MYFPVILSLLVSMTKLSSLTVYVNSALDPESLSVAVTTIIKKMPCDKQSCIQFNGLN